MKILVIAGEASADLHAGHLVGELAKNQHLELVGIGGDQLIARGLKPIRHARDLAVVGLTEALKKIPQTLKLFKELEALAVKEKPDFALLLDLPDFNLRMAARLKKLGVPVVYYISPQVWAWRSSRVIQMAEVLDLLLLILPFEPEWYRKNAPGKLRLEYVGHPVIEQIPDLPYEPVQNQIALMPGSRESEWEKLFGPMIGAAALLGRGDSRLQFHLPLAETLRESALVKEYLSVEGPFGDSIRSLGTSLHVLETPAHEVLRKSLAAWIASGTATLEAAVVGTPMVVVYKVNALTAFLFRNLIRYSGPIAIVNIIHGGLNTEERVVPEILQQEVEPEILASSLREVMSEPAWTKQKEKLVGTRAILTGEGKPVANAANAILRFLKERK
ncbi:MAG: lipid-A-disaccharide synthase [Bdellovibrionota bacterium]